MKDSENTDEPKGGKLPRPKRLSKAEAQVFIKQNRLNFDRFKYKLDESIGELDKVKRFSKSPMIKNSNYKSFRVRNQSVTLRTMGVHNAQGSVRARDHSSYLNQTQLQMMNKILSKSKLNGSSFMDVDDQENEWYEKHQLGAQNSRQRLPEIRQPNILHL